MKKMRLFLCCLGAMSLMTFIACTDTPIGEEPKKEKEEEKEKEKEEEKIVPTEGIYTEAFYKGDLFDAGSGNLWINFVSDMEQDKETGDYIGPGYILCLDFNTVLVENSDLATLAAGVYTKTPNNEHPTFSLNLDPGDSFLARYTETGSSTTYDIKDGTVTVSVKEGYYFIEAKMTLNDDTSYDYSFIGKITFFNRSDEGFMSNLTGDVSVENLTQAAVIYGGQAFTETSDLFMVIIAGPNYDLAVNYGASDALMISVNVPPGSSEGIPSGTYTVVNAEADDYPVGTFLSGLYNTSYGGYLGTWFYSTQNKLESSLQGGQVEITNQDNKNYTFRFEFKDGYDHKVKGSYSGPCIYQDWS